MDNREVLGRQLAALLLGSSDILLYGASGSGKTYLLSQALTHTKLPSLSVPCSLLPSLSQVLHHISNAYNLSFHQLDQFFSVSLSPTARSAVRVFVFDKAEQLMETRGALLTLMEVRAALKLHAVFVFVTRSYPEEVLRRADIVSIDYLPIPLLVPSLPTTSIVEALAASSTWTCKEMTEFLQQVHSILSTYSNNVQLYTFAAQELFPLYQRLGKGSSFHAAIRQFCEDLFLEPSYSRTLGLDTVQQILAVSCYIAAHTAPRLDVSVLKTIPQKRRSRKENKVKGPTKVLLQRVFGIFDILYITLFGSHYADSMRLEATVGRLTEKGLIAPLRNKQKFQCFVSEEEATHMCEGVGLRLGDYIRMS